MSELIDLDVARQHIPTSRDADEPLITTLITFASKAVQRHCRRDFVTTSYDELYDGSGDSVLILKQYPIQTVQTVRATPSVVLNVRNTQTAANQQARVSATATGLMLKRVASGVATTNTVAFAANVTLSALASAVTALGNGWTGQASAGFESYPSADLFAPQGAFDARGRDAGLRLHVDELQGFGIDAAQGFLVWPDFGGDDLLVWQEGSQQYRVQYTAGYSVIPEDVQEACAELVASWFANRGRDVFLAQESVKGSNYFTAEQTHGLLPGRVRALLRPYRNHRV